MPAATASKTRRSSTVRNAEGPRAAASPAPADRTPGRVRLTIALDGVAYSIRPLPRDRMPFGAVRGFILTRSDPRLGKVCHAIAEGFEGPVCSCQDATFRQLPTGGVCKHIAGAIACGLF